MTPKISIAPDRLAEFCRRWHVAELALFGSVLRDDFDPLHSDIDVLVEFEADSHTGLLEFASMRFELEEIFGRRVDLVSKRGLKPRVRPEILASAQIVYVAAA